MTLDLKAYPNYSRQQGEQLFLLSRCIQSIAGRRESIEKQCKVWQGTRKTKISQQQTLEKMTGHEETRISYKQAVETATGNKENTDLIVNFMHSIARNKENNELIDKSYGN